MFLAVSFVNSAPNCFPRIRGDVPVIRQKPCGGNSVFPAYAGMFRTGGRSQLQHLCFPRIRGDVPTGKPPPIIKWRFSPHTRGCSSRATETDNSINVFPAYAGMFLRLDYQRQSLQGFPRIRGDVPFRNTPPMAPPPFSPHTRGCSAAGTPRADGNLVFPAYAGMFRVPSFGIDKYECFPRIRGDVPLSIATLPIR